MTVHIARRRPAGNKVHFKPRLIAQHAIFTDNHHRLFARHTHHIVVTGNVTRNDINGVQLRIRSQFNIIQQRHRRHTSRQGLPLFSVIKLAIVAQYKAMISRVFNHLRRPDHATASIITAKHSHDHPIISADILEPSENTCGNVDDVTLFQHDFARVTVTTPEKPPSARQYEKYLGRAVRMQGITTLRRLTSSTNVKPMRDANVNMLIGALGHTTTNNCKVLFGIRPRRMSIDKRRFTRT